MTVLLATARLIVLQSSYPASRDLYSLGFLWVVLGCYCVTGLWPLCTMKDDNSTWPSLVTIRQLIDLTVIPMHQHNLRLRICASPSPSSKHTPARAGQPAGVHTMGKDQERCAAGCGQVVRTT